MKSLQDGVTSDLELERVFVRRISSSRPPSFTTFHSNLRESWTDRRDGAVASERAREAGFHDTHKMERSRAVRRIRKKARAKPRDESRGIIHYVCN